MSTQSIGTDRSGSATAFAVSVAISPQTAGLAVRTFAAREMTATRKPVKARVPITPTPARSMAPNDDGRLAPSPTPIPNVSPTMPREKRSAVVLETYETLPTLPFTTVCASAMIWPR